MDKRDRVGCKYYQKIHLTRDVALPERLFEKDVPLSLQFGYYLGGGGGHELHVRSAFFVPEMDGIEMKRHQEELGMKEEELKREKRNTLERSR